jgi:hypothetical protein
LDDGKVCFIHFFAARVCDSNTSVNPGFSMQVMHPLQSLKLPCKFLDMFYLTSQRPLFSDFWQYFEPIRLNMPMNCSADVQAVISYVDHTFKSKDVKAIQNIKDMFGMAGMAHLDDVAGARMCILAIDGSFADPPTPNLVRNNLWDWQSLQPTSGPGAKFYNFCDALEVNNGTSAPASGWGLDHALPAWAAYFKNTYLSSRK